jgi:hypothetical protein
MENKEYICEYLCPGCSANCNEMSRYEADKELPNNLACSNHSAGTFGSYIGRILLGFPNGFCRYGFFDKMPVSIFAKEHVANRITIFDTIFNIPVWKYVDRTFDKNGVTFVRWISPRTNASCIDVYLCDMVDKIGGILLTKEQIDEMD